MYGGNEHGLLPQVPLPHVFSLHFIHLRLGPSLLSSETEAKTLCHYVGVFPSAWGKPASSRSIQMARDFLPNV